MLKLFMVIQLKFINISAIDYNIMQLSTTIYTVCHILENL